MNYFNLIWMLTIPEQNIEIPYRPIEVYDKNWLCENMFVLNNDCKNKGNYHV